MANDSGERNELVKLYARVFSAETDTIPLVVSPPCPNWPPRRQLVEHPETAVVQAAQALAPKVAVGSDWIPSINLSWFQCIAVPSLFGAPPVYLEGSEPIVEPFFGSVDEAVDAGVPVVDGPVVEQMLSVLDSAFGALPEGFSLSFPPTASPFDLAQLLLPADEFLISLLCSPDAVLTFLDNLARLCVDILRLTRTRLRGTLSESVTNRGLYFPGLRLPCDALVNFPPDQLRDLALPVLRRFGREFGPLCIHYCTKPAPSNHVLQALCADRCVGAVDTWQGPDAFIGDEAPARLQDRVALIFDMDLRTEAKMDAFLEWEPVCGVPRKGGRALVLHTGAASVDDGRRIYDTWQARMAEG